MLRINALRLRRHELPLDRSVNMMPMIDVAFQLILFFILTASFVSASHIELDLPESSSGGKGKEGPTPLEVTYRLAQASPEIALNGARVDGLDDLRRKMASAADPAARPPVDVRIDRKASYQEVIAVIDAVRTAGFPKFSLLALSSSQAGGAGAPPAPAGAAEGAGQP